jgi:hypothetical protein
LSNKKDLLNILNDESINYDDKASRINIIIKRIIGNLIFFDNSFTKEKILKIDLEDNLCFDQERNKLLVPSINLITENSNEQFYYERFYDEILRYDYIRKFIFDTDVYLSLIKQSYNLNDNEFILPNSLLTSKYFENLTEVKGNLNKMYDTAYPQIHIPHSNIHKLIKIEDDESEEDKQGDTVEDDKIFQVKKGKKKINRCPNGFRRVDGICEPIDKSEWEIMLKDETKIVYKSTKIENKTIEILLS